QEDESAWREGHRRLYQWYSASAKERPDTIEEMAPLYAAVVHGCRAGRHQEVLEEVFLKRIQRSNKHYSIKKLGAFGANLSPLSGFFEGPWPRPVTSLRETHQSFVLGWAGFVLRALGRLEEAVAPMQTGLKVDIAARNWVNGATEASNLSELQLGLGQV